MADNNSATKPSSRRPRRPRRNDEPRTSVLTSIDAEAAKAMVPELEKEFASLNACLRRQEQSLIVYSIRRVFIERVSYSYTLKLHREVPKRQRGRVLTGAAREAYEVLMRSYVESPYDTDEESWAYALDNAPRFVKELQVDAKRRDSEGNEVTVAVTPGILAYQLAVDFAEEALRVARLRQEKHSLLNDRRSAPRRPAQGAKARTKDWRKPSRVNDQSRSQTA